MSRILFVLSLGLAFGCASSGGSSGQTSSIDSSPTGPYGQATADYVKAFLGAGYLVGDLINPTPSQISAISAEPCAINIFRQTTGLRIDFRRSFQLSLGTSDATAAGQPQSAWVELSGGVGGIGGFSFADGTGIPPANQRLPLPAVRFVVQGERELSATRADLLRIVLKDAVVACGGRVANS